jgi:hypothetical protein
MSDEVVDDVPEGREGLIATAGFGYFDDHDVLGLL